MPNLNTKKISNRGRVLRAKKIKADIVKKLGGKCQVCGYDKCMKALVFHHINPIEKSFKMANSVSFSKEKVNLELKKCALLCSNCHAEVHAGLIFLDKTVYQIEESIQINQESNSEWNKESSNNN